MAVRPLPGVGQVLHYLVPLLLRWSCSRRELMHRSCQNLQQLFNGSWWCCVNRDAVRGGLFAELNLSPMRWSRLPVRCSRPSQGEQLPLPAPCAWQHACGMDSLCSVAPSHQICRLKIAILGHVLLCARRGPGPAGDLLSAKGHLVLLPAAGRALMFLKEDVEEESKRRS